MENIMNEMGIEYTSGAVAIVRVAEAITRIATWFRNIF